LNPELGISGQVNIAEELYGKKVLVGGIEGLSRFTSHAHDINALQLFGNGAGVIGVIPGETMKFLVGKSHEAFDDEGVLAVHMYYPHSRQSLLEISRENQSHIRVAGLMHEPENGQAIEMAGPMGMVKLFVRTGVQVVADVYQAYQNLMDKMGMPDKSIVVGIVHHANYKINKLKGKHLQKLGISFPMPWLVSDFGNVSAASNMIAFLRQLPNLKPGDHILFDGFGAGTYYDVLAVSLGS
jgi:3-oxoacyl-[acyl-carrier-protein] synthase III